jgi:hypothetical protein
MALRPSLFPIVILAAGLAIGLLSAEYMMDRANLSKPAPGGKWKEIQTAEDSLSSTYLIGHFLGKGQVPPPRGSRMFVRREDDDGNSLRGDCVVSVEGRFTGARWWFVSAATGAERASLDAAQTVRETSGETTLSISTTPVPGNWLIPPRNDSYELQLMLLGIDEGAATSFTLPRVKRLWC